MARFASLPCDAIGWATVGISQENIGGSIAQLMKVEMGLYIV